MTPSAKEVQAALKPKPLIFGLTLRNVPTIHLRQRYAHDRRTIFADDLAAYPRALEIGRAGRATITIGFGPEIAVAANEPTFEARSF